MSIRIPRSPSRPASLLAAIGATTLAFSLLGAPAVAAAPVAPTPATGVATAAPDAGVINPFASPIKRDPTPIIAFAGQYAPNDGRPAGHKGCRKFTDPAAHVACLEHLASDWAYLARFAAANAAIAPTATNERRVVFFGDSITDNWSKVGFGGFFPGKPYVNRGISGQTTPQMLIRFRPDVVALKPRVVVILAGTNDVSGATGPTTPEQIENNLAAMAELARAHGIRVVLASLLPTSDEKLAANGTPLVRSGDRPLQTMRAINTWMAQYARAAHVVYLDYFAALADEQGHFRTAWTDDGLHPNPEGYAVMAPLAEKAISAALGR